MWATRPHLGSIFEKLLHRKTFQSPAACLWETICIRLGKAGAHSQLALGIAIAPETLYLIATFQFLRQLRFFRFSLRFLFYFMVQFLFASQMWAARPHLGSIFEKLLHRKTFYSPAARCLQSCDFDAMFHVKHSQDAHSTSFEKTVETSMIHDAYIDTVFHRKNS